jgi:hypothetical protein
LSGGAPIERYVADSEVLCMIEERSEQLPDQLPAFSIISLISAANLGPVPMT